MNPGLSFLKIAFSKSFELSDEPSRAAAAWGSPARQCRESNNDEPSPLQRTAHGFKSDYSTFPCIASVKNLPDSLGVKSHDLINAGSHSGS